MYKLLGRKKYSKGKFILAKSIEQGIRKRKTIAYIYDFQHNNCFRLAFHCGMNYHASAPRILENGLIEMTLHECREMHRKRILVVEAKDRQVIDLKVSN